MRFLRWLKRLFKFENDPGCVSEAWKAEKRRYSDE